MAYSGSLFQINGTEFPHEWIYKDSYSVTPHTLDLDSTTAATGFLQRNVLDHKSVTVSFDLIPMSLEEYDEVWEFIRSRYLSAKEKRVNIAYYDFEIGSLVTTVAYVPDITHNPYYIKRTDGLMNSTTLEFIGY